MNIVYLYCTIVLTKHLIFAEFVCNNNAQCNGHGECKDEQCDCDSDWSSQVDCSGNITSPSFNMYTKSLVNTNLFYMNSTNTHFQKIPIPHLTRTMKQKFLH